MFRRLAVCTKKLFVFGVHSAQISKTVSLREHLNVNHIHQGLMSFSISAGLLLLH